MSTVGTVKKYPITYRFLQAIENNDILYFGVIVIAAVTGFLFIVNMVLALLKNEALKRISNNTKKTASWKARRSDPLIQERNKYQQNALRWSAYWLFWILLFIIHGILMAFRQLT